MGQKSRALHNSPLLFFPFLSPGCNASIVCLFSASRSQPRVFLGKKQNMWEWGMWKLTKHTFVHISVCTVKFPVSTVVGVFLGTPWCVYTEILNFRGHFCGHLRVHFREHFRERVRGSNLAVRVLCAFLASADVSVMRTCTSLARTDAELQPPSWRPQREAIIKEEGRLRSDECGKWKHNRLHSGAEVNG